MTEPLDMSKDPDRTLPELLGEGAYEGERDNATWLWGLVGVLAFLALVSLVISQL